MKSMKISTQNLLQNTSLKKSNIKSRYKNIFFGLFLALYFRNPLAGVAVSLWSIETRNNKKQPTLAGWVLASSVCA